CGPHPVQAFGRSAKQRKACRVVNAVLGDHFAKQGAASFAQVGGWLLLGGSGSIQPHLGYSVKRKTLGRHVPSISGPELLIRPRPALSPSCSNGMAYSAQ